VLDELGSLQLRRAQRAALLLGGEAGGHRLEGWLPVKVADPEVASGPGFGMCVAFRVAAYLQRVLRGRQALLNPLRRVDVPLPSQGPPG
jgi:hypothetical protein